MKPRPAALADITALLIRAQSGEARQVLDELDGLLAEAQNQHAHDRAQWLRFVRFASYHELHIFDAADEVAVEMIRLAEPFDDRIWEAFGHSLRGMSLLFQGTFESAYEELARAVVLLEELDTPSYAVAHAINAAAIALGRLDLYELATTWLEKLYQVADQLSDAMLQTLYAFNSGWLHLTWAAELELIGENEEARDHYRQTLSAFEKAPTGLDVVDASTWPSEVVVQGCLARAMLGEGKTLIPELRENMTTVAPTQRHETTLVGHLALARAFANDGETGQALEEAEQACGVGDTMPRLQVLAGRAYWEYAELLRQSDGDTRSAAAFEWLARRLVRDRWVERRARVLAFEERLSAERVLDEQRRRAAAYLTDPLTGLGNRRLVEIRLPELLVEAEATRRPLAVGFIDLDDFKSVNDELSHLIGDDLLRELAQELRSALTSDDVMARFGGDEFVIVLPDRTAGQAYHVAEHLRRKVEERVWKSLPKGRGIRMSAGLAESWTGATRTQLLAAADEALLRAKRQGKNRVEIRAHPLPDP
ncbi:GGDEF domain-containing protein [Tenggerimyces flavus]|uniref:Diguanylate cyclase n=1 Tax=Tenggerimyces flavus TaxID=1708749 RepID=A0ABV7YIN7_9ACTN|nr:GGDEF domain-containing protein [Tenggerimyces flavus]MBM7789948.1 diguanylate cyclase (GGDEF)-like protein [Tenggerimyces flavus]